MSSYKLLLAACVCLLLRDVQTQCPPGCSCPSASNINCVNVNFCPVNGSNIIITLRITNSSCGNIIEKNDVSSLVNLTSLELTGLSYQVVGDKAFSDTQLTTLKITRTPLQSFFPGSLSGLNKLTSLDLSYNQISVIPDNLFQEVVNLQRLTLVGNHIAYLSDNIFTGLSKLIILDLSNNSIGALSSRCFLPLTSLKSLKLSFNNIAHLPDSFLTGVPITSLIVDNNQLSSIGPDAFTNSSLVAFKLDHNSFTQFPKVSFLKLTTNVQAVILSQNNIDKIGVGDVARVKFASLDLTANPLKSVESGGFAGSIIKTLTLVQTQLTSLPVSMLTMLTNSSTKLDLSGTNNWQCDCQALWLAEYLIKMSSATSPVCTTGLTLINSFSSIQNMCTTTTITTPTTTTTITTLFTTMTSTDSTTSAATPTTITTTDSTTSATTPTTATSTDSTTSATTPTTATTTNSTTSATTPTTATSTDSTTSATTPTTATVTDSTTSATTPTTVTVTDSTTSATTPTTVTNTNSTTSATTQTTATSTDSTTSATTPTTATNTDSTTSTTTPTTATSTDSATSTTTPTTATSTDSTTSTTTPSTATSTDSTTSVIISPNSKSSTTPQSQATVLPQPTNNQNPTYGASHSTSGSDDATVNMGLIIGMTMGLTAAIIAMILAICVIRNKGTSVTPRETQSQKQSKKRRSDNNDSEAQHSDEKENVPNIDHGKPPPYPRPAWLNHQQHT